MGDFFRVRKSSIVCMMLLLLFIFSQTISTEQSYNILTNKISCLDKNNCLHEATHKFDVQNGFISIKKEFRNEIDRINNNFSFDVSISNEANYILYLINTFPGIMTKRVPDFNPINSSFWFGGWGGYIELYATIAEYSNGDIDNIPESLREFYDMEEINKTMKGLGY